MLKLSTSMIEHLMQLFNLKPNVNSNLNDCMKIIIKPILLFDVSMEIYSNFPQKQLLSDEQKHFNTIKNWLRRFEHDLFAGMTFDEKLILSDAMSEFVDYIQNDINALEDSFNTFLGDKYDNEYKSLLTQLYLISTLSQCVVLYLKDITNHRSNSHIDRLNNVSKKILKIQKLINKRSCKTQEDINPNIDSNINSKIEQMINSMCNYL